MADIITYPEDGIFYDAEDASGFFSTRLSGVYSAEEDFAVTAVEGLSVQVSAGQAWVRPQRFRGRSIIMEQPTTVVLTEADPVRSRIDRLVLRYDAAAKKTTLVVLDGEPDSAGPVAPDISRTALIYDLCLAEIRRPAGSTEVTAADITDTRADESVCGVMRDGVTGIPTGTLVQQWQAVIESMKGGSFYTRAEVDALLDALQEQVAKTGAISARLVYGAIANTTQKIPDNVDYIVVTNGAAVTLEDGFTRIVPRGKTITTTGTWSGSAGSDNCTNSIAFAEDGTVTVTTTKGYYRIVHNIIGFQYVVSASMPCIVDAFTLSASEWGNATKKVSDDVDYITFSDSSQPESGPSAIPILRGVSYSRSGTGGSIVFAEDGTVTFSIKTATTFYFTAYHYTTPTELNEKLASAQAAQADTDAMTVDQEYRIALLELGITDETT